VDGASGAGARSSAAGRGPTGSSPAAGEPARPLRILVVDDDPAMVGAITALVGTEGHHVVTAYDGDTAVRRWHEERPDLILLDLAMPGYDGFAVAGKLRAEGAEAPIIIVSGESSESAKVRALDLGADDYLVKPFGKAELLARVRAALRRRTLTPEGPRPGGHDAGPGVSAVVRAAGLTLDASRHVARAGDRRLQLTPTEYRLLDALARASGNLVSHERLLAAGGPGEPDPDPLWLKPHLARLRRKLANAGGPGLISVRAVGWRLRA
jgi:DNA-binding response OmpR family regulator